LREQHFSFLLSFAVCGLLESRLGPTEAGIAFDPDERVLLVASASAGAGTFVREALEPSGVTPEVLRQVVLACEMQRRSSRSDRHACSVYSFDLI
jgi:hypothetical protein